MECVLLYTRTSEYEKMKKTSLKKQWNEHFQWYEHLFA